MVCRVCWQGGDEAAGGEGPDGVDEGQSVEALDEVDDVSVRPAAEAGEAVWDTADGQGRGRVVMEGTAAGETLSGGPQLHACGADDVLDREVGTDRGDVDGSGRDAHSCTWIAAVR